MLIMRRLYKPFPVSGQTKLEQLDYLRRTVNICQNCPNLVATRTQTVLGEGNPDAQLLFVGEAPGLAEDLQGRPFVGRAGKLLDLLIRRAGFTRKQVWLANAICCRPDTALGEANRPPSNAEIKECLPYLLAQIQIVQPKVIVALGNSAMDALLWDMDHERGQVYDYHGIYLVTTYHPAYVLRNPTVQVRAALWEHFLCALDLLGIPITDQLIERAPSAMDVEKL